MEVKKIPSQRRDNADRIRAWSFWSRGRIQPEAEVHVRGPLSPSMVAYDRQSAAYAFLFKRDAAGRDTLLPELQFRGRFISLL